MNGIVRMLATGAMAALAVASYAQSSTSPDERMNPPAATDRMAPGTTQYPSGSAAISEQPSTVRTEPGMPGEVGVNTPKQHFYAARDAFNNGNYNGSAQELRRTADLLRDTAAKAHGDVADDLRGTSKDLDKLADRVQKGELRSWNDVNDKMADAYKNLADYHYQVAQDAYKRNRTAGVAPGRDVETGNALNAAADNLEEWSRVTGRALNEGARKTVSGTRELAGKMISGTGWVAEQAGQSINRFGETLRDFGRGVRRDIRHPFGGRETAPEAAPPVAPAPGTEAPPRTQY